MSSTQSQDPSTRSYNPNVRVGNWNEEICLEEDILKDFLERQEHGSLLIQRTQSLMQTMLAKSELDTSNEEVRFGSNMMLVNPGKEGMKPNSDDQQLCNLPVKLQAGRNCAAISVNVDEWPVGGLQALVESPLCVTGGGNVDSSCVRNTFKIIGQGRKEGEALHYGDRFAFQSLLGHGVLNDALYLFTDRCRLGQAVPIQNRKLQGISPVTLVSSKNIPHGALWIVESFDPLLRLEHEGLPVPKNEPLVLKHVATGQHLAVIDDSHIRTPFGAELSIGAQTFFNSHKAERDNNYWILKTK